MTLAADVRAVLDAAHSPTSDPKPLSRRLTLTPASAIKMRPVLWLWFERLALSSLALLGGREGIGKTIMAFTLAADVTRGRLKGVHFGSPRSVIIAATEDSWEHTIVPRLMAADADLDRVFRVDVVTTDLVDTALSLPRDLAALEEAITERQVVLVILDPLIPRLDVALDSHKDQEVRQALEPIVTLANRTAATFLGLIHVNKSASTDALTTLMGSRAFAAVARAVLFVMVDPDDEHTRMLGQPKNNLGRADLPTLSFRIAGAKIADTLEGPVWTGKLEWMGEATRSIRDALAAVAENAGDRSATSEAGDWLVDFLTSVGGSADGAEIRREAQKAGHTKDALYRARTRVGVLSTTHGFPRKAVWALSSQCSRLPGETTTTANNTNTANTGAQSSHCSQYSQSSEPLQKPASTGANPEVDFERL